MRRECNIEEISDGRRYHLNDLVKADCGACEGCYGCCHDMGNTIQVDPLDAWRLCTYRKLTFEQLLAESLELSVVDGVILPNINMQTQKDCVYLNEDKRCSVHPARPGICRLFPLGRIYENGGFSYFLQVGECHKQNLAKIKVKNWIAPEHQTENQKFINDWHYFIKDVQALVQQITDDQVRKQIAMLILQSFYLKPYEENTSFYTQFDLRLKEAKKTIDILRNQCL